MAKERTIIPADRPLISGENIATINGQNIIGKNVKDVSTFNIETIDFRWHKVMSRSDDDFSDYNNVPTEEYKYGFPKTQEDFNKIYNIVNNNKSIFYAKHLTATSFNVLCFMEESANIYFAIEPYSEKDTEFSGQYTISLFYDDGTSKTFNDFYITYDGRYPLTFGLNKKLNYSLGKAIAVDAVETVEINTLTDNKIIITSIKPTTAVEGLILSTPYYNGTCWCLTILNKSTSSFNGDLEIIYKPNLIRSE